TVEPAVFAVGSAIAEDVIAVFPEHNQVLLAVGTIGACFRAEIGFDDQPTVDEDVSLLEQNGIERHTNDPFDRVINMAGVFEYHEVTALGRPKGVGPSIEQEAVALVQGRRHAVPLDNDSRDY